MKKAAFKLSENLRADILFLNDSRDIFIRYFILCFAAVKARAY
jgi:hypothetical protein